MPAKTTRGNGKAPAEPPVLAIDRLTSGYGSVPVLHELSLDVSRERVTVVLGANGVGKTTLLRAVSGTIGSWDGAVTFEGVPIQHLGPEARVRMGIGTVPEPPAVFRNLSVVDNLSIGALPLGVGRRQVADRLGGVLERFPVLAKRASQIAGSLSGGEQRMLAIARALMGEPRLLLVDEASMGLSPSMVSDVLALLGTLCDHGVSVFMAEQDLAALDIADHAYVVEQGRVVHTASGEDLSALRDEAARVYLGAELSGRRR